MTSGRDKGMRMPPPLIYTAATVLLLGLAPLPYGFYTLLRLVTCCTVAYAAVVAHGRGARTLPTIFAVLALLFNPVIPVYLSREVWAIIDLGTAVLLLAQCRFLTAQMPPSQSA